MGWGGAPPAALRIFHRNPSKGKKNPDGVEVGGCGWDAMRWEWARVVPRWCVGVWGGVGRHLLPSEISIETLIKVKRLITLTEVPSLVFCLVLYQDCNKLELHYALSHPPWYSAFNVSDLQQG